MNRGIVVKVQKRHQIVLTPTGEFKRIPLKPEAALGEEIRFNSETRITRSSHWVRWSMGAAAVLLLLCIPWLLQLSDRQAVIAAYLTMDINPSLEIGVDRNHRVVELQALNPSAAQLISGIKFEGAPLDRVAESIIDHVNAGKYFKEGGSDVFITSVLAGEGSDIEFERSVTLQLTETIQKALMTIDEQLAKTVEINTISVPFEVREEAIEAGLSTGKMAFYLVARSLGHDIAIEELRKGSIHKAAQSWGGISTILNEEELFGPKQLEDKRKNQKAKLKALLEEAKKEQPPSSVPLNQSVNENKGTSTDGMPETEPVQKPLSNEQPKGNSRPQPGPANGEKPKSANDNANKGASGSSEGPAQPANKAGQGNAGTPGKAASSKAGQGNAGTPSKGASSKAGQGNANTPGKAASSKAGQGNVSTPSKGASSKAGQGNANTPGKAASSKAGQGNVSTPGKGASPKPNTVKDNKTSGLEISINLAEKGDNKPKPEPGAKPENKEEKRPESVKSEGRLEHRHHGRKHEKSHEKKSEKDNEKEKEDERKRAQKRQERLKKQIEEKKVEEEELLQKLQDKLSKEEKRLKEKLVKKKGELEKAITSCSPGKK